MIANYHTHTWRCNHAKGTEREYVEAAISRGLQILGFYDHTPYPFPWYHHSFIRMGCNQLPGYVQTIGKLREEFRNSINIFIGLEAEYYPAYFAELRSLLVDNGIEYLILGQHFLDNEVGARYSGKATDREEDLIKYCAQTRDAMQTGCFSYFAHPDLIRFIGDDQVYTTHIRGLCREANSCGIPLEWNLLGMEEGKHYPRQRFWEIAAEEGCKVIFGCDTHDPAALRNTASEEKAVAMIRELGLEQIHRLDLRSVTK